MIYNWRRIVGPDEASSEFLLIFNHKMRLMNLFRGYTGKFLDIASNVGSVRVKLFALQSRIENPITPHGIGTGRGTPLPISVVGGHIRIEQLTHEVPLAALPVD